MQQKKRQPTKAAKKVQGGVSMYSGQNTISLFGKLTSNLHGCGCEKLKTKLCLKHSRV